MEKTVKQFIEKIKSQFLLEDRIIGYEYKEETGFYRIWHTKKDIEKSKENRIFIGNLIKEMFYDENMFDVSFVYSYIKDEELKMALKLEQLANYKAVELKPSKDLKEFEIIRKLLGESSVPKSKYIKTNNINIQLNMFDLFNSEISTGELKAENDNYALAA